MNTVSVMSDRIMNDEEQKKRAKEIEVFVKAMSNIWANYMDLPDSTLRYTLILEKMMLSAEIAYAVFDIEMDKNNFITNETKEMYKEIVNSTRKDLRKMMRWIHEPTLLNPDHPNMKRYTQHGQQKLDSFSKDIDSDNKSED